MYFDNCDQGYEFSEENYSKAVQAAKQELLQGYTVERDSAYLVEKLNFVQDISKEARARGVAVADALCAAKGIIQALRLYYNNNALCEQQISTCNTNKDEVGIAESTNNDSNTNINIGCKESIICSSESESKSIIEKLSNSDNNTHNHLITTATTKEESTCHKHIELCFMEQLVKVYTHLYLRTPVPTLVQWRRTVKQVLCSSDKDKNKGNTDARLSEVELAMLLQKTPQSSSGVMKQLLTSHLSVLNNTSISAEVDNHSSNTNDTSSDCRQCTVEVNTIATQSVAEKFNSESHLVTNNDDNEDEDDEDNGEDNGEQVEQYFKCFLQGCVLLARRRLKGSSKGTDTRTKSTLTDERNSLIDVSMRNEMITAIQRYLLSADIDW